MTARDPKQSGTKKTRDRFLGVFPSVQAELLEFLDTNYFPEDSKSWFKRNIEHNVPGGKLYRGMSVINIVEIIRGKPLTDGEYFEVAVLGWSVELLQAFLLVADDIMDDSITRRGQPCWYRTEDPIRVGLIAINDAHILKSAVYFLLKRHFKHRQYYVDFLELFHDMAYMTELGQLLDLTTASSHVVDLSKFSLTKHRLIAVYKTAYYSFYLPVALAMLYTGIPIPAVPPMPARTLSVGTGTLTSGPVVETPVATSVDEAFPLGLDILLLIGEYAQVQDDYLDCFGKDIGKIGTDIIDNKCSWVICTALELVNAEQRKILDENYGRKDDTCESRCKDVFEELGLRAIYTEYEETTYKRINALIDRVPEYTFDCAQGTLKKIFMSFLQMMYRRQK